MAGGAKTSGRTITLTAADGFAPGAFEAPPEGEARGGLVIFRQIFGETGMMNTPPETIAAARKACAAKAALPARERSQAFLNAHHRAARNA